ncbi:right-handed parallel beta-helix repeat-containing protein, partial [bacterium]|nr:right-handed parallel beta-helix repeat-containing protein [bacterium]
RYNTVYANHFDGFNIEKSTGVKLYYNLSYGHQTGAGIQVDTDVHHNELYNNVCYGNRDGIWITSWEPAAGGVTGNLVKNNILAGNASRALRVQNGGENDGTNGSGNVYTHNALGLETANFIEWGSGVYQSTYAAWETTCGGKTHSVQSDPLFVSTSDFHLTATSAAINAGVNVGLTIDYEGHDIRGLPDIGAYEYSILPASKKVSP